jgi:hypothetical protein
VQASYAYVGASSQRLLGVLEGDPLNPQIAGLGQISDHQGGQRERRQKRIDRAEGFTGAAPEDVIATLADDSGEADSGRHHQSADE